MASTWSDSRVLSATVASTAETEVGSVNVPSNQTWLINGLFGAHAQGGTFRIAIDSIPGMNGVRIQNSVDGNTLSAGGNGSSEIYPANFVVQGPATVTMFTSNLAAGSATATAMINYQVTQS
tara:strand:+ start:1517 stop:1882 length:366 start_codon:yes stop_codon:yes gene_type:complete